MADSANDLLALATVKTWLKISDTTFDTQLALMISGYSHACNILTGRQLLARDLTEYYDGNNSNRLFLYSYPINSIASLYIDTDHAYAAASALTVATDILIYKDEGIIEYKNGTFPAGPRVVKITYNAGYSISAVALADLQLELLNQLKYTFARYKDNTEGITSINISDGGSIARNAADLLPSFLRVLKTYKRKGHTGLRGV